MLHPELQRHFEEQRGRQQYLVRTAEVKKTVRATRDATHQLLDTLAARGSAIDMVEERATELEAESAAFERATRAVNEPWWRKMLRCACVPAWWCH